MTAETLALAIVKARNEIECSEAREFVIGVMLEQAKSLRILTEAAEAAVSYAEGQNGELAGLIRGTLRKALAGLAR